MITEQQRNALLEAALEASRQAHAPYSSYHVGAALLCSDGTIVSGCNVENASYGLTICAERVAIFTSVAAGQREFTAIAIATADAGSPCGACRQVMAEFCRDLPVFLVKCDDASDVTETSLDALLPMRFGGHINKELFS